MLLGCNAPDLKKRSRAIIWAFESLSTTAGSMKKSLPKNACTCGSVGCINPDLGMGLAQFLLFLLIDIIFSIVFIRNQNISQVLIYCFFSMQRMNMPLRRN